MNILKAGQFFRNAGRLAVLFAMLIAASGVRAQDKPQASRFLLIFETSPVLKKNLPAIQGTLATMFSSNMQNEIRFDDDIAVWTVDDKLHTGTFPLESWSPADAADYTEKLNDFIVHQKFSRHASLAALQPLLNRVVKGSARLTVLIFCDSESELIGTPYDSGVNDIITNAAARLKGTQVPFILVLRSYQGEYLGCSVNRSEPLNFPKFPALPKPAPAPVVINPAPAPVVAPVTGPVVTPVQALIVIGTNLSTNASILLKPANVSTAAPTPPPVMNPPPMNTAAPTTPAPTIVTAPENPTPVPTPPVTVQPLPAPAPPPQKTYTSEPSVVSTPPTATPATPAQPQSAPQSTSPSSSAPLAAATTPADAGYLWPMLLGGGLLVAAIGIVIWFMTRSRGPQGSLITSSMQDDPRLPPRK